MSSYHAQIRSAIEALHIDPDEPDVFYWFGMPYRLSLPDRQEAPDRGKQLGLLSTALTDHLYQHFYCSGGASPHAAEWRTPSEPADAGTFALRLSRANSGRGSWGGGWQVVALSTTTAVVTRGSLTVTAPTARCRVSSDGVLHKGAFVALRRPNGSFHRSPGFYVALGDLLPDESEPLVRIYWNVSASGAALLIEQVTERLNRDRVPFHMKVLDDPRSYARCDSAVLYVAARSYARFRATHAGAIVDATTDHLGEAVPSLTKRVCAGVGLAEDVTAHSFGAHRCGALARAIVDDAGRDHTTVERVAHVVEHVRQAGIDVERPYLRAGSQDRYGPFPARPHQPHATSGGVRGGPAAPRKEDLCSVARAIGRRLVETARWHAGRCNWTGAQGLEQGRHRTRIATMGPDLYDGTSGIALFLGELFRITGDHDVGRTACGAVGHALDERTSDGSGPAGFHIGALGVAAVAARLGRVLEREDIARRGDELVHLCPPDDAEFDLLSGVAGRIVGFLTLHRILGGDHLIDAAVAAGHVLVERATAGPGGVSWRLTDIPGRRNLTGLSHGAAGAALALLELYAVSDVEVFKRTATSAMDYERSWFDEGERNWPDLRQVSHVDAPTSTRLPYAMAWCHGAPGIAVSRIRAAEILPGNGYRNEAIAALTTTRDHLRRWLRTGSANYSLCHGIAGNAEILLTGARSPGFRAGTMISDVERAAGHGLIAHADHGDWPCGVGGGGSNPSLMLGLAGIGHFYLRLACTDTPSVLAPLSGGSWAVASVDPTDVSPDS